MISRPRFLRLAALAAAVPVAVDAAPPEPRVGEIAACTVSVPRGDYALVTLVFDVKGAPKAYESWTYVGGMRAGRMRMDDGVGLTEPGGWLELKDGKLQGSFRRNNSLSTSSTHLVWAAPQEVRVDASVTGGAIAGSATIGASAGTVSGRIVGEAELAARNAVAADKSWPNCHGPVNGGCAAQATGAATVDAVAGLRQVWRCEEGDVGQGLGSITRFMDQWKDASGRRAGANANSPVVADGRLYLSYFVPAPRGADAPERPDLAYKKTQKEHAAAMLAQAKAAGWTAAELPAYAAEKIWQCAATAPTAGSAADSSRSRRTAPCAR
jgi:hypothetical protein